MRTTPTDMAAISADNAAPEGRLGSHALVRGASIAGLAVAAALSDRFDRVTVVDRDMLPAAPVDRRAVAQGRHGHGLLASGLAAFERLCPNLESDLIAAGAVAGDVIGKVRWFQHGCYKARFQSGLRGVLMSRPLLEGTIRARVRQRANVRLVEGRHVIGLICDRTATRVAGVRTRPSLDKRLRMADLVVDASGRASRSPT